MRRATLTGGLAVALLAALISWPTPATGTPPTGAGDQPSFRLVPLRGVDARGRPSPPAASSEPASPVPPTPLSASPSLRAVARLAAAARPKVDGTAPTTGLSLAGQATTISGVASWFRSPAGVSAAGPRLRSALGPGWRGTRVRVCTATTCATTMLGDWMRADRLIDLDAPIFARLAPLSAGLVLVTVTPILTPPETSTGGTP